MSGGKCIDTSVAGELIRVVFEGLPSLQAATPETMLDELRHEHEAFRRSLLKTPSGYSDFSACLMFPPTSGQAAATLVVAARFGYVALAGTPMMAASSVLHARRNQTVATTFRFDTAKGMQTTRVQQTSPRLFDANWKTARPEVIRQQEFIQVPEFGSIPVSIISAGLPYLVVDAVAVGLDLQDPSRVSEFAIALIAEADRTFPLSLFGLSNDAPRYCVELLGNPIDEQAKRPCFDVRWVGADGWIAPSPAGTGAAAAASCLVMKQRVAPGDTISLAGPSGQALSCVISEHCAEVSAPIQHLDVKTLF